MSICKKIEILLLSLFFLQGIGFSDIVKTKDGLIIEGTIIEDVRGSHIKIKNYHGEFRINQRQIKSVKEDRKTRIKEFNHLYKKRKPSSNKAIKKGQSIPKKSRINSIFIMPFILANRGKLKDEIPYSYGISMNMNFPELTFIPPYLNSELSVIYSSKNEKKISGTRISAGPFKQFNLKVLNRYFPIRITTLAGAGFYKVVNDDREESALKWHASLLAGPVFNFTNLLISFQLRFDYIHDSIAPLYSAGITAGAGVKF